MKFIRIIFMVVFFSYAAGVFAGELPDIQLEKGENTIALSIFNKWKNDLSNLTVKIDKNKLPEWLNFYETPQTIFVPSKTRGREKLFLKFVVINAPIGAKAEIPFTLFDENGNKWNYSVSVHMSSDKPHEYALYANYPNPFNPTTTIRYTLKESQHTKLIIFNILGQKIRTLVKDMQPAGVHSVKWDGRSDSGETMSSGVYFYRLRSGNFVKTRRMALVE